MSFPLGEAILCLAVYFQWACWELLVEEQRLRFPVRAGAWSEKAPECGSLLSLLLVLFSLRVVQHRCTVY